MGPNLSATSSATIPRAAARSLRKTFRDLARPRRPPSRPGEAYVAGVLCRAFYRTGSRIELSRPDLVVGSVGLGVPFFGFLRRMRLCPFAGPRFGHVVLAFHNAVRGRSGRHRRGPEFLTIRRSRPLWLRVNFGRAPGAAATAHRAEKRSFFLAFRPETVYVLIAVHFGAARDVRQAEPRGGGGRCFLRMRGGCMKNVYFCLGEKNNYIKALRDIYVYFCIPA